MKHLRLTWLCGLLLAICLSIDTAVEAQEVESQTTRPTVTRTFSSTAPITISANRVQLKRGDEGSRVAIYSGQVVVKQATLSIRAQRLKMIAVGSKIQSIDAQGSPVTLHNTDQQARVKATAKRIIYDLADGWLELSEGQPKVSYDDNQISGHFIRYRLTTGDIEVEGHQDRPAVLMIDPNQ